MKVLFAVSDDTISNAIIDKYQKQYKELLSYKNVYYFNAILKEIQRDKSYDRIVISEDLEEFPNNNYDAIDKSLFEKLDQISDEATDIDGNDTPIIFICSDRRTEGSSFFIKIFGIGVYNALIGSDRSFEQVCKLISKPRTKKEAKIYYKVDSDDVNYVKENDKEVSEVELQNILNHFKKLGKATEKYAASFENIAAQYTDEQLVIIINCLPFGVKQVLEKDSEKYQEIMKGNSSIKSVSGFTQNMPEEEKKSGINTTMLSSEGTKVSGPIVIPSSVKTSSNKNLSAATKPVANKLEVNTTTPSTKSKRIVVDKPKAEEKVEEKSDEKDYVIKIKKFRQKDGTIVEKKVKVLKKDLENKEVESKPPVIENKVPEEKEKATVEEEKDDLTAVMPDIPEVEDVKAPDLDDDDDFQFPDLDDDEVPGVEETPDLNEKENDEIPGLDEDDEIDVPGLEEDDDEIPGLDEDDEIPGLDETDDEIPSLDEEDDDEIPGLDEDDEIEVPGLEEEDDEIPGLDEDDEIPSLDEEDDDEIPGLDEDDEIPGIDEEDDDEIVDLDEDDEIPGVEEVNDEISGVEEEVPGLDDEEETMTEEVEIPGLDDLDDDDDLLNGLEDDDDDVVSPSGNSSTDEIESIKPAVDYSMSSLNSLLTKDKKIVTFIGTSKNGTTFLINNLAVLFSAVGINTAILDMTKNRNDYYIFTNNQDELRKIAETSTSKLINGYNEGIKINNNLSVFTAVPGEEKDFSNAEAILSTLVQNYSLVLIDCDFDTDPAYFASCQEIYLVQSCDCLTMQPLLTFMNHLRRVNAFESEKVRVVINKQVKLDGVSTENLVGALSLYTDPAMTVSVELFNANLVKICTIPFDLSVYTSYLNQVADCKLSISKYPKSFMDKLRLLGDMVYPLVGKGSGSGGSARIPTGGFGNKTNETLNKMKKKF